MKQTPITFEIKDDQKVLVHGYPPLAGHEGHMLTDVVASFRGEGWNNCEWYLANVQTGKIRQLSTSGGRVTIDDSDINYEVINLLCEHGARNAECKLLRYGSLGTWDGFKDGFCAISWTLYPDGRYFADSDGYGMEDNDEETIYGIVDENLNFVVPFRPILHIRTLINEIRQQNKQQ